LRLGAALLFLALAGCDRGSSTANVCRIDSDCPGGMHCVPGTGVCTRFLGPLDDLGSTPDLAVDAAIVSDGSLSDASDAGD
jgi:hypothetical protein